MTLRLTMRHVILAAAMLASSTASCSKATCEETATCGVASGSDAGADSDGELTSPARCNPRGVFGGKTRVPVANEPLGSLTLSADERTGFFGVSPIYRVVRDSVDAPFEGPMRLFDGTSPSVAPNGDRLFFARRVTGVGTTFKLWWTRLEGATFYPPLPILRDMIGSQDAPAASTKNLYFTQSTDGPNARRIWLADWANDAIGTARLVDLKIAAPHDEDHPAVTNDDRVLYFSLRDDTKTGPSISRVVQEAGVPSVVEDVEGLTNEIDFVSWVSTDDCVVYGVRGETAYRFRRAPL